MNKSALVVLASGQTLTVKGVKLFPESIVREIAMLKAKAIKGLEGVSTGVGFIGSPEWVLGGAAVLGLFEGLLSAASQKASLSMLQEAEEKSEQLYGSAVEFPFPSIFKSHFPHPQAWYAIKSREVQISDQTNIDERQRIRNLARLRDAGCPESLLPKQMTIPEQTKTEIVSDRYVHSGDEFVTVTSDIGSMQIRWSFVVGYFPQPGNGEERV
jgi:hypothetical protein